MANSIEWRPPTVTHCQAATDESFMSEGVLPLGPEDLDLGSATEELERAQAGAGEPERGLLTEALNNIWHLPAYDGDHPVMNELRGDI